MALVHRDDRVAKLVGSLYLLLPQRLTRPSLIVVTHHYSYLYPCLSFHIVNVVASCVYMLSVLSGCIHAGNCELAHIASELCVQYVCKSLRYHPISYARQPAAP